MKRILILNIALILILVACGSASSMTPAQTSAPTLASAPTAVPTAMPATGVQRLEGIWVAQGSVYIRQNADGRYTVVDDSIRRFLGHPLEGTVTMEGDTIKLSGEKGCAKTDVGIYRIKFSEKRDSYTLTLIKDPCEYRKGGDVPAANTYHKLEPLVLPGTYSTEITQAEAQKAGGGDLLNYVGAWELQLNADNKFVLLQNGQSLTEGEYLSAGEQFTWKDDKTCPGALGPVVRATIDEAGVMFSETVDLTNNNKCVPMLLILTAHPWTKK